MWIILAVINISLAFYAELYYSKNKAITIILLGSIVLINTFFIGLRDFGVGTDTTVYIEDYFSYAGSIYNFGDFIVDKSYIPHDKGFVLLALIANIFSYSPQALLVVTEFFITLHIVIGVYEYKKVTEINFAGFFLLFWLLYQYETTNLMRQFCAMALLFYGYAKLLQKKYVSYFLIQVIAFFFHSTSLLFLLVPLGFFLKDRLMNYLVLVIALLLIGFYFLYAYFYEILYYLNGLNIVNDVLTDRYGVGGVYGGSKGHVSLKFLLPIVTVLLARFYKLLSKQSFYMLTFLLVSTFLLEQTKFISEFFFRISYYPGLIFIVYFSEVFKRRYWRKMMYVQFLCIAALLYYAYGAYTFMESSSVGFMYRSKILGID